jgi:hypothetical protein
MLLLYAIVIWGLSAARVLLTGTPTERSIAAPRNKRVKHKVFFILILTS